MEIGSAASEGGPAVSYRDGRRNPVLARFVIATSPRMRARKQSSRLD